jgi:NADPH-dependent glutamate synthase beta subunit-like oxidoreductase
MAEEEEDLRLVKVQLATCSKCGGAVKVAVSKYIDRATTREFAKLMEDGCEIHTTNVIVARTVRWCDAPCEGMWPKSKK